MEGLKSHKNVLEQSHKEVETHAHLVGHQHMQARQEERGPPPPIWDLKTTFPPLKFLKSSIVKRPKSDSLNSLKRWYKNLASKQPKRVNHP